MACGIVNKKSVYYWDFCYVVWYLLCFVHTDSKNPSTGYKKICLKRAKDRALKNE